MLTPPVGLDEATVADAAASWWGLRISRLSYIPRGAGSYHWQASTEDGGAFFLTVDDLRDKPWLGAGPDATFAGLRAAFGTALALRERARLPFVVAPLRSLGGDAACRLTAIYSLAVFPFVNGQTGQWGALLTAQDRDAIAGVLARLHLATPAVAAHAPRRGLELHGRAALETALGDLGRPWPGGPLAEPARRELSAKAEIVTGWLARFDDLAAQLAATGRPVVITHGEPHAGNVMRRGDGIALIDWDTVALGPPERDLWMLDDGSPGALDRYRELAGTDVDDAAVSFYRLAWTLFDIAAYTGDLRSPHRRSPDSERALRALRLSLQPDRAVRPAPYRYSPA